MPFPHLLLIFIISPPNLCLGGEKANGKTFNLEQERRWWMIRTSSEKTGNDYQNAFKDTKDLFPEDYSDPNGRVLEKLSSS